MKTYMLFIIKPTKDAEITDKTQRSELFKGHFSNMEAMEKGTNENWQAFCYEKQPYNTVEFS